MVWRTENKFEVIVALFLITIGIFYRVMPHPANFAPVTAVALFAGVVLTPGFALCVPLLVMIVSDLVIGPHPLFILTWGCFFLSALIGVWVQKSPSIKKIVFSTLAGSILFL